MRAVINLALLWDHVHQQLWLQLIPPVKPLLEDQSDSRHFVPHDQSMTLSHTYARIIDLSGSGALKQSKEVRHGA